MEGINTMVKAARDRWKEYNRHNGKYWRRDKNDSRNTNIEMIIDLSMKQKVYRGPSEKQKMHYILCYDKSGKTDANLKQHQIYSTKVANKKASNPPKWREVNMLQITRIDVKKCYRTNSK